MPIAAGYLPGQELADYFDFELLDGNLYHADGHVRGEAYEYTSFLMSRMAARGVVCQDCHEVHTARLRAEGDGLCLRCHAPELATPNHTHHAETSSGGRCVSCHMPVTVFMERDARRDHEIARPDPEGAAQIGAPDACTMCHRGTSQTWAAGYVRRWYGPSPALLRQRAVALAFHAAADGDAGTVPQFIQLLQSDAGPVRRASVARWLGRFARETGVIHALMAAADDPSPLVRSAAVRALGEAPQDTDVQQTLLRAAHDSVRLVRIEAGFSLRVADLERLSAGDRAATETVFAEWLGAQDSLAELPETHYNRGVFFTGRGEVAAAEAAYRRAIRLWSHDLPPRQNLALLLATSGRAAAAEAEWKALLALEPKWPPAAFSLGLLYGEQGRSAEAAEQLEGCLTSDPSYPRAAYNLGLAYAQLGDVTRAEAALERAVEDPAARSEALRELVRMAYIRADTDGVNRWLPDALRADPRVATDPMIRRALGDPAP
jgi:predicted CXXCH cytochrome family protein